MLRRLRRGVPEPRLQLKQGERLTRVEELRRDRRPRAMCGDPTACVFSRDASLLAQRRNVPPIPIPLRETRAPKRKQKLHLFARLFVTRERLGRACLLPCANSLAHDSIDGLGNAVLVLLTGTSSKHTRSASGVSPWYSMQPTRKRRISSWRKPAKSHTSITARIMGSG